MESSKLTKFDFISDLHLDFYFSTSDTGHSLTRKMGKFVERLLPKNPSKVLIVPGDLSHYNHLSVEFLKICGQKYEQVLYCLGNHDYWLISKSQRNKYGTSYKRVAELTENQISENVHFMDGLKIIEVDGVKFGGASSWYDGSHIKKQYGWIEVAISSHWRNYMNDWKMIWLNEDNNGFDLFSFAKHMNENIFDNFLKSDVFFSHVQPIETAFMIPDDPSNGYYCFNGTRMMYEAQGKVWVYGHTHVEREYTYADCNFLCNPYGYPGQNKGRGIKTFDLESRKIVVESP